MLNNILSRKALAGGGASHQLESSAHKIYRDIGVLAIINLCFMICVFSPFALYSSDVRQFDVGQSAPTLAALAGFFVFGSAAFIYVFSFLWRTRLLKVCVFCLLVATLIAVSYTFIFTGNIFTGRPYAQIDGLLFRDGGAGISFVYAKYFDVAYALAMMLLAVFLLRYGARIVRFGLIACLAVMGVSVAISLAGIISDVRAVHAIKAENKTLTHSADSNKPFTPPSYIKPYLAYSKEKNLVVLFSDMIQADNFTQALKDYPEFADALEGFTYYENSLSASNITFGSAPSIAGGAHYRPLAINERKSNRTIADEASQAYIDTANAFADAGYDVALGFGYPGEYSKIREGLKKDVFFVPDGEYNAWEDYYKQTRELKDLSAGQSPLPIGDLFSIGLFRAAPYIGRTRIYQAEGWIFGGSLYANHFKYAISNVSRLPAFSAFSTLSESSKPTFKLLYEAPEHFPWLLDPENDCKPIASPSEYRARLMGNQSRLAYDNHICHIRSLIAWLQWFKDSKIYDKTKFVIVSDHGNGGVGAPILDLPRRELRNSHNLVLVKEFNAKGKLKVDRERLVSNSDTMAIMCDEIGSRCPNIEPSVLTQPRGKERELVFTFVDGGTGREGNTHYDDVFSFKVKNSIFDLNNWQNITESVKNGSFKLKDLKQ